MVRRYSSQSRLHCCCCCCKPGLMCRYVSGNLQRLTHLMMCNWSSEDCSFHQLYDPWWAASGRSSDTCSLFKGWGAEVGGGEIGSGWWEFLLGNLAPSSCGQMLHRPSGSWPLHLCTNCQKQQQQRLWDCFKSVHCEGLEPECSLSVFTTHFLL